MAGISKLPDPSQQGIDSLFDDDADATAANDVMGGPCTLVSLTCVNADVGAVYVKLWDAGTAVVGTDDMDFQFYCAVGTTTIDFVLDGTYAGARFATGLCYAVTTDAGTAGNTSPATPVDLYLTIKDE